MFSHISTDVTSRSHLCKQLWGDKVRTELWAAGWLAGASRPWGHLGVSRPSTETAVHPQQGEISSACRYCTSLVLSHWSRCLLGITDAAFLTMSHVSGTRNACLQTLSFGLAYTSVKLVHPPAVYQRSSQQAQRLQVDLFFFFFNILSATCFVWS